MIDPALRVRAEQWRDDDPDPDTVAEIDRLIAEGDEGGLRERFDLPLAFGTAGLRGPLGAGPGRMNRVVVRRTAAAIGRWLDAAGVDGPVVVGRDARHGSDGFASDTARVLAAAGRRVFLGREPVPTPLLAFAVLELGAAVGIMVTASHNPPRDNGYKVYAAHGAQIVPPVDTEIVAEIERVGRMSDLPLSDPDDPAIDELPSSVRDRYLAVFQGPAPSRAAGEMRVAYTPLHGVGGALVVDAFDAAGLAPPHVVAAQADPDPDFPTVAFPNPEEPGATDRLLALAQEVDADLAIANDPDADRLAVAVPDGDSWRVLTGDEVGVLLADHLLRHSTGTDRLVATTVVSSSLLRRLALHHGVEYAETLTGFKWLAHAARVRPELRPVLAYEEALGYCVGDRVHDKDGVSAAVEFVRLAAEQRDQGSSVTERLDELARDHGLHMTTQWSTRFAGLDGAAAMAHRMAVLRSDPPAVLGSSAIVEVEDLLAGSRLPATDAVVLRGDGIRVVVRPSGTEPKLKAYVEVVVPVTGPVATARGHARAMLDTTVAALVPLLS